MAPTEEASSRRIRAGLGFSSRVGHGRGDWRWRAACGYGWVVGRARQREWDCLEAEEGESDDASFGVSLARFGVTHPWTSFVSSAVAFGFRFLSSPGQSRGGRGEEPTIGSFGSRRFAATSRLRRIDKRIPGQEERSK
ncbi:hypothetical protein GUJ93_ZPchr0008g11630 [Zizania palustris]|uniref:Uncharacterized protein n=1 Tax=Zizania palustris TaxID=103762 RepID=A0A8J5RGI1_ZIZPA|nr:hypothetical protein GUJ93_ZPchr0008g11630 [Zizania palustris]